MIVNRATSDIQIIGDIKEYKTSIDPKNLDYITTLLSSSLYSHPEESFIREIVSNAWDSHLEAGTTDIPIIVRIEKNTEGGYDITIRDFGTGISPKRFKEIYCNIGSSTKRESNEYIGGFGIGRYSAIACSNTVYITSYYEGTMYQYVMLKSGNTITTTLLQESATEEKNGLEVSIKGIVNNIYLYELAIDTLIFFPNVYADGLSKQNTFNETKTRRFKNFACATAKVDNKILIGNVLYPCDTQQLSSSAKQFLYNIRDTGIVVLFNIGELDITPNRENIIYTSKTLKLIENRITKAKEELDNLAAQSYEGDYDNLLAMYLTIKGYLYYYPIENMNMPFMNIVGGYRIQADIKKVTYKGNKLDEVLVEYIKYLFNIQVINTKGKIEHGVFRSEKTTYTTFRNDKILCLTNCKCLSYRIKEWLKRNYDGYTIVFPATKMQFIDYIHRKYGDGDEGHREILEQAIDYLYEYFTSSIKTIDISNDKDFLDYKARTSVKSIPTDRKRFLLHVKNEHYSYDKECIGIKECIEYLKSLHTGVVLIDMKAVGMWEAIARMKGYACIRAAKGVVASIYKVRPSCLIDTEWLLTKDPLLAKTHTITKYFWDNNICNSYKMASILDTVPKPLKTELKGLVHMYNKILNYSHEYFSFVRYYEKDDEYTEFLCRKLLYYYTKYNEIYETISYDNNIGNINNTIINAAILKSKAYRIDYNRYNEIKNNKLLQILCRK